MFALIATVFVASLLGSLHCAGMCGAFVALALEIAPMLLAGLVLAAAVQTLGANLPLGWMRSGHQLLSALRGAVIGVPLPVCTCGVLPTARALLERGASPALLVAFVVAAPVLGLDTFLVTARLIGVQLALARALIVVVVAVVAALALTLVTRARRGPMRPTIAPHPSKTGNPCSKVSCSASWHSRPTP